MSVSEKMTPFQKLVKASTEPDEEPTHNKPLGRSGWLLVFLSITFLLFLGWIIFSEHWLAQGISNTLMHISF
jgi:hypothetical protein